MIIHGLEVKGKLLDSQTRCQHYHKEVDIVAIKFKCCHTYYSCYQCHHEIADHPVITWNEDEYNDMTIPCGNCCGELTKNEYINHPSPCPRCEARFNSNFTNHIHLYFEM